MRKNSRLKLVSPLLAVLVVMAASAFSDAQVTANDPGTNDPVGAPASYITLRDDELALATYVKSPRAVGGSIEFDTYPGDLSNPGAFFSTPVLTSKKVASAGSDNSDVAGRIFLQDKEDLVNVGRSATVANAVRVRFKRGEGYILPNLHKPLDDAPDQISAAAGDLDKIPDANGANHDELVVAYPDNNGQVNVAVLNYTAPPAIGTCGKQPAGSCPKYVTKFVMPSKINLDSIPAQFPINGDQRGFKVSEVLALAIGDFDGDGQNEIALATFDPVNRNSVNVAMLRYVHPTLSAMPTLQLLTQKTLVDLGTDSPSNLLPTISLAAGNFEGTGRADLVVAYRYIQQSLDAAVSAGTSRQVHTKAAFTEDWLIGNGLQIYSFDGNLNPTQRGFNDSADTTSLIPQDLLTPGRILCLPGLINYDPGNGFNLYRRGVVVLHNDVQPADGDAGAFLRVDSYTLNTDPDDPKSLDFTQLGGTATLRNIGVGASWAATLGAFGVNGDITNPVWSLAVAQLRTAEKPNPNQETVSVFQNIDKQGFGTDPVAQTSVDSQCASVCDSTTQNQLRPAIQAYDYLGRTVLLGAPVKLTVPKLITTDFMLQDPPKHAYWDEAAKNIVVVSRNSGTNVSLTNKEGKTYSGKSTDMSASSVGGSVSETASLSVMANVLGLFQTKFSAEETAKATYNYDQNQASYNSTYTTRTVTETGKTDTDDFISGRYQKLTIWRYRVLGATGQDSAGKSLNLYYDVVFPGPPLAFTGAGRSFDFYQPIHEPGNILSYPAPSNDTFSPADLGSFGICPAGAKDCKPADATVMNGPMIGNIVQSLGGAS